MNGNTGNTGISNGNSAIRKSSETLEYYDYFFSYIGLTTLQFTEGLVTAFVFGFMIVKVKEYLKLSPMQNNIAAFFTAWYAQTYFITKARQIEIFKKKTDDKEFIESKGSEYVQDMYYQQDSVHSNPPEDIYKIVKE